MDIFFGDVFWVLGAVFWGDAFWVGMTIRGGVRPGFQVLFDFTSLHFLVRLHADVINFMLLNSLLRE